MNKDIKVTFPHLGSYCVPIEVLFRQGLDVEYITPPPITKRTLELGSRYSPDFVCAPFKYNLGNYIETIELGANTIAQVGGECRLGYYGELHEQILCDLGYRIHFVNMAKGSFRKPLSFYELFREINPEANIRQIAAALRYVLKMVTFIDEFENEMRQNIGFERISGSYEGLHKEMMESFRKVSSIKEFHRIASVLEKQLRDIPTDKPKHPLRIGIIGEYYTIMEPFSNHFIEKEMAKRGIVVDRWMNISNSVFGLPIREMKETCGEYVRYNMGATSMATISKALEFAKNRYDGLIHVKSFGCTPEMDAMPVLQNISKDYKIPILFFSFDSQTGEEGIQTRLEAFYDMIMMRKEASA
ncbi:MAG: 2-hydroxyacyl-CoA dehydratase [Anaerofustis sp.]